MRLNIPTNVRCYAAAKRFEFNRRLELIWQGVRTPSPQNLFCVSVDIIGRDPICPGLIVSRCPISQKRLRFDSRT